MKWDSYLAQTPNSVTSQTFREKKNTNYLSQLEPQIYKRRRLRENKEISKHIHEASGKQERNQALVYKQCQPLGKPLNFVWKHLFSFIT